MLSFTQSEEIAEGYLDEKHAEIYKNYQATLKKNNAYNYK